MPSALLQASDMHHSASVQLPLFKSSPLPRKKNATKKILLEYSV